MKKTKPKVSIIMINWNGIEDTLECLNSLKNLNYKNTETIVIDNGSAEVEPIKIKKKFPNVKMIRNKINTGFCKASNMGILEALKKNSKYILFLNNDTVINPDFLSLLVDRAERNSKLGMVSPKILYYNSDKIWSLGGNHSDLTGISRMIGKGINQKEIIEKSINPDFLTGCCLLIKKEVIEKVGYLDEKFFAYLEDLDYSRRVRKAGFEIETYLLPKVWHKKSASAGIKGSNKVSAIQAYLQMRNSLFFIKKNYHSITKWTLLFSNIIFKGAFLALNSANSQSIGGVLKGIRDGLEI